MSYFLTGGTGFIGRHLIERLVARGDDPIHLLVREGSEPKVEALRRRFPTHAERLVVVRGDLAESKLGVGDGVLRELKGKIDHFFHLAALYDLTASPEDLARTNADGTLAALDLAEALEVGCFHHVSSIAAAGLYDGTFDEEMYEEAREGNLEDPYFQSKHVSEGMVRARTGVPFRIYRPSVVVGHSRTGEMDKIDGPYYAFKLIQRLRKALPPWVPMLGLEGRRINIVPVDYVAAALDHLAHKEGLDGRCFHLTDPKPLRVGQVMNTFCRAANAPQMTMRVDARMVGFIPASVRNGLAALTPVRRITDQILKDLQIPRAALKFVDYPTRFDCRATQRELEGSGIHVPPLATYAGKLWDYWERHLDPDLFIDRSLKGRVEDRVVMVTGASSGIGRATALRLAEAGAELILVARGEEKLREVAREVESLGGRAHVHSCDLADLEAIDRLAGEVVEQHGRVDILVNNAGRSIRRSIALSYDRFHDFQRTMQLNYFGALRLIMALLPSMAHRHSGHIVNVSSIGVLTNAPRFSAYVASKSALDAFSRCAASEYADSGVHFTTINMPLVRTPMIAPTKIYRSLPAISPEEAANMVAEAIVGRPKRIATRLGIFAQVLYALAPRTVDVIMNTAFRMFPDSAAAKGKDEESSAVSQEQMAFAYLMQGIHL